MVGGQGPQLSTDDVNEIFQAGVPLALKEQLKLITGSASEKTKAWMIKEWLDRSGYTPVTKIAVQKKISLDEKTLRVLAKISQEDGDVIDAVEIVETQEPREGERTEPEATVLTSRNEPELLPEKSGEPSDTPEKI